ncbi:nucleoside hydrolase [Enteractinococcus coprophilus]|uniref:Purine nucleosidase n=2 Tax=Micrococcales TaxID=85006 RepID=A0A543A0J6_9MICC|nr:nucleoside hydrolase [Enteractinococcus coprophilus]TQL66016.1 purine nucleosidase [Enteractinococcus coprophilus]
MSTPPPLFTTEFSTPTPVLLDTDIGSNVDDLLALLFMLGSRNLRLVGVTTVYGDTRLRAKIAAATLSLAGRDGIPIGFGSEEPRSGRDVFWAGHEGEGFDLSHVEDPETTAASVYAQALQKYGSQLVIAAIGPLTNAAEALEDSKVKPRCVVAMAGQFEEGRPDHNVFSDAVAAGRFMELGIPIICIGIELCRQVPYDPTDLETIQRARPAHRLTQLIVEQSRTWWQQQGLEQSNPCDPLTLLALSHPEVFEFQQAKIQFPAYGSQAGQTRWMSSDYGHQWFATGVDVPRARRLILDTVIRGMQS